MKKIKEFIMNEANDDKLYRIERVGFMMLIISTLVFFPLHQIFPKIIWWQIGIFLVGIVLVLNVGIIWFMRGYIPFFKGQMEAYYLEHPEDRPKPKKKKGKDNNESKE